MIKLAKKSDCCGCSACVQRCPAQCITIREDEEGFLYPVVDESRCIDCHLCEKVCPVINKSASLKPLKVLAAQNKNENQRLRSSSGGIFVVLAEQTIRRGGVVCGARFDENWEVEHAFAGTLEELEPLMRSKYLQSRIGDCYKKTEQFLKQGREVLFAGTGCQIAGLNKFLRKNYDNLLTVDVICHGVPSPGIWREYINGLKGVSARSAGVGKNTVLFSGALPSDSTPVITGVNFREKQLGGFGWKKFGFVVSGRSPVKGDQNSVLLSLAFYKNAFMKAFLQNMILRPSCYECPSKDGRAGSDLTLADYWGCSGVHPDFDDDKGTSIIFVHTQKGSKKLSQCEDSLTTKTTKYEDAVRCNPSFYKSVAVPVKRPLFWGLWNSGKTLDEVMAVINFRPLWKKILSGVFALLRRVAANILRILRLRK